MPNTTLKKITFTALLGTAMTFSPIAMNAANAANFSVFSTGVDAFGNTVSQGSIDQHWTLDGGNAYINIPGGRGQPNTTEAQWISISPTTTVGPVQIYSYTQTFDLSGLNFSTANLSGLISSDNGAEIFLNGISTGFTTPRNQWRQPAKAFNLTSGFVDGLNTLEIQVNNSGGADTGLYVDITGAVADSKDVPEPITMLGSATALGFGAMFKKSRQRKNNQKRA